jgi:hypothetical protein
MDRPAFIDYAVTAAVLGLAFWLADLWGIALVVAFCAGFYARHLTGRGR